MLLGSLLVLRDIQETHHALSFSLLERDRLDQHVSPLILGILHVSFVREDTCCKNRQTSTARAKLFLNVGCGLLGSGCGANSNTLLHGYLPDSPVQTTKLQVFRMDTVQKNGASLRISQIYKIQEIRIIYDLRAPRYPVRLPLAEAGS